ncbi:MAG TPA: hypothetical protein VHG32_16160 [Thermoanaerobaculia bacterium]|jgi:hypothetical protein|nr:hypothetical protein [Thermoanaerobaculia bacterium]
MSNLRVLAPTPKLNRGGNDYLEIGSKPNFTDFAQAKLGQTGIDIANDLLARCESAYSTLQKWFSGLTPPGLPFRVYVTGEVSGAMHFGCANVDLYVGTNPSFKLKANGYALLLAAEVVEVFGAAIRPSWNCGHNNGEGLSRVLANALYPNDEISQLVTSNIWLDRKPRGGPRRENWVDQYDPEDKNAFSVGCSVLFLNWLRFVRGKDWPAIIAAGDDTLAGTFQRLTGQRDAWQQFSADMEARFPSNRPSNLTTDNPFGKG